MPLDSAARALGLSDAAWAGLAGVPKETLSRLRRRSDCDLGTLQRLATAVNARLSVEPPLRLAADSTGHFPEHYDRDAEQLLLKLALSAELGLERWLATGPRFFMAGLAMLLANARGFDRSALVTLAEALHPGSSEPAVFALWLAKSPVRPDRLLPQLAAARCHAG